MSAKQGTVKTLWSSRRGNAQECSSRQLIPDEKKARTIKFLGSSHLSLLKSLVMAREVCMLRNDDVRPRTHDKKLEY